ncbi:MAG: tetratricopeptide repeat protein [Bdellovibrionota bacterium]
MYKSRIYLAFVSILALVFAAGISGCSSPGKKKAPSSAERAQILVELALEILVEGDATGALLKLKEAEALNNQLPDLFHVRALAFYFKKDYENAIQNAHQAIQIAPEFSGAKTTLGVALLETGRMNEAIAPLIEASNDTLYREAFKAFTTLGIIYYKKMNYPKAREYLTRAIDANSQSACKAYYYRGHIAMSDHKFSDALKDYDSATRSVCAGFADAYLAKGIAYERAKNYDEARKIFLLVHQRFPKTEIAEEALNHYKGLP